MINALRKCTTLATDLRVRGAGMGSEFAGVRNLQLMAPVQSGGKTTL